MFSYHPMSFIRAGFLMFVAAELLLVAGLMIQGIASLFSLAIRSANFACSFVSLVLR